jgi:hypothetical protein
MTNDMVNASRLAELAGCTRRTIERHVAAGRLAPTGGYFGRGGTWHALYRPEDLETWAGPGQPGRPAAGPPASQPVSAITGEEDTFTDVDDPQPVDDDEPKGSLSWGVLVGPLADLPDPSLAEDQPGAPVVERPGSEEAGGGWVSEAPAPAW